MRESQIIELKSSWRDEHLKWISGFANAQGGKLVIGKSDDGKVLGLPDVDRLLVDIPNKVVNILGIVVDVNRKGRAGREYLEIVVKPHRNPVSYRGEYYVRSGSTNQELRGAALDRFLFKKLGQRWDGVALPGVSIRMLDGKSIRKFRQEARNSKRLPAQVLSVPTAELLEKIHLTVGRGEHAQLKRAAVLAFHPDPERFFTGAYVKVGFFHGEGGLLYHDEIHGSLFSQVNGTMDMLLTKYLRAMVSFRGIQRVETFPVPHEALREAVMNAVTHKDYTGGAPIQIRVYEDMIRISNSAHLPDGWTAETLMGPHRSEPPNPDIANTFFRAGMIESWGGGMEMMGRLCLAHGLQAPQVFFDGSGL